MRLSLLILILSNFNLLADEAEIVRNIPIIGKVLEDLHTEKPKWSYEAYEAEQVRKQAEAEDIRRNKIEAQAMIARSVRYYSYNDTDNDGYLDITESKQGTNPVDPRSKPFGKAEDLNNFYKNK